MPDRLTRSLDPGWILIGAHALAGSTVFWWMAQRMRWGVGDPVELVPALVGLGYVFTHRGARSSRFATPVALALLVAATLPQLLSGRVTLPAAGFTMLGLAWVACAFRVGTGRFAALAVLGLASLPLRGLLHVPLDQPLRLFSTWLAAPCLRLMGFAVEPVGTGLRWAGHEVWIDSPCSGVRFLWTAFVLAAALALVQGLGNRGTLVLMIQACVLALIANVMRTTSLFLPEIRGGFPAELHTGLGLVLQALLAVGLGLLSRRLACRQLEGMA